MCMHRGQPPLLTAARRGSSKKKQSASSHPARLHTEVKRTQGACSTFPHCNFNDATSWSNSTPRTTGKTISSSVIASEKPVLTDRKSTRLNSSHVAISYAVFCLKKK